MMYNFKHAVKHALNWMFWVLPWWIHTPVHHLTGKTQVAALDGETKKPQYFYWKND